MWDDVEMFHIDTFLPLIFSHLCGKMDKIRYRLVYNRQNTLNRQGTALVQVEAYLNQRKIYLKTNVYLKPECWSREGAQVIIGVLEARNTCHTLTAEGCCQEEKCREYQLLHFRQISH